MSLSDPLCFVAALYQIAVSILVLMDESFRRLGKAKKRDKKREVSILVLMDESFRQYKN